MLSRRPVDDDCSTDEEPRQCKTVASRTEAVREQSDTKPRVQAPAGESLTDLQRQDPDIGPILRLRLQQSNQPRPETVISESERFHGTLNAMMGKVVSDSQKDWDLQLPFVMASYRSTVHATTNFTPNYFMMAREVRAPAELVFGTPVSLGIASAAYSDRAPRHVGGGSHTIPVMTL